MRGEAGGSLGEEDAEVAGVALEEADEHGGALGGELVEEAGGGLREADGGDGLPEALLVGVGGVGGWGRVEAELLG